MTTIDRLGTNRLTARIAGALYLVVVITGFFSILHVPSQLIVAGDAAATVSNIVASKLLFQLGIAAALVCYCTFLVLPLVLYLLLGPTDRRVAALMVALAVASVPISLLNVANKLDVITLLSDPGFLQAFGREQLNAHVMLLLESHKNGMRVSEIFWGLWLLPFGYLVFRSGLLPRVLGVLLMVGCFGYLIDVFGNILSATYAETTLASLVTVPSGLGEIGTCLWLLIMGIAEPDRRAARSRTPA